MSRSPIVTKRRLTRARRRRIWLAAFGRYVEAVVGGYRRDSFLADIVLPIVAVDEVEAARCREERARPVEGEHPAKARLRAVVGPGDRFYDETLVLYPAKERT